MHEALAAAQGKQHMKDGLFVTNGIKQQAWC
jgi:hypothetical protein